MKLKFFDAFNVCHLNFSISIIKVMRAQVLIIQKFDAADINCGNYPQIPQRFRQSRADKCIIKHLKLMKICCFGKTGQLQGVQKKCPRSVGIS